MSNKPSAPDVESVRNVEGSGAGTGEGAGTGNAMGDETARENVRHSLFMQGELRFEHMAAPEMIRIRNLSKGGMLAETPLPARQGEALTVYLPNIGPVRGRVAWVKEGRFGVVFDDMVDPHLVRRKIVVTKPDQLPYLQPHEMGQGRPGVKS